MVVDEPAGSDQIINAEEAAPLGKQLEIHASLLNLAVKENDKNLVSRVLHHLSRLPLDAAVLGEFASKHASSNDICKIIGQQSIMNIDGLKSNICEAYAWLLTTYWLAKKQKQWSEVALAAEAGIQIAFNGGRIVDGILAKLLHYLALANEKLNNSIKSRHRLMIALRQASLTHCTESVAVAYNWILRTYVVGAGDEQQPDIAAKFVERSSFPADASNAQACRYHYYLGRIEAIQAKYEEAREHLQLAIRKAPHGDASLGLVQSSYKLLILVELLLGDIPERSLFSQSKIKASLEPYLVLVQSVRLGDLSKFQSVVNEMSSRFKADATDSLVARLHQNVLRTGLKHLCSAYIRISLKDVASKLGLPSVEDAEFVVMKAIKDGVIHATVDHSGQYLASTISTSSYNTSEPHTVLHERIQTAQAVYKHSAMAMRYPQSGSKNKSSPIDLESPANDLDMMDEYMEADDGFDF